MVKMIVGNRGTGKTKALMHMVEEAARQSKGNVVCIERGDSLKFDLSHKIRLVDIKEYSISGSDAYYGFIAGLLAGNYDITEIFADATFKIICGKDSKNYELLADFMERIENLTRNRDVSVTFSVSCDPSELPQRVRGMILQG